MTLIQLPAVAHGKNTHNDPHETFTTMPTTTLNQPLDVWLLPAAPASCEPLSSHYGILSDDERETARRIAIAEEQRLFIRSRAFLRKLLQTRTGVAAHAWRFDTNGHGRPLIAFPEQHRGLHFNLSHTRNMTACVLAAQPEIGIDVESVTQTRDFLAIARAFFAPEETQALARVARDEQRRLFYRYWTLKEAYIKAIGTGLATPLASFSFTFTPAQDVAFCAGRDTRPEDWRFLSTELPDDVCLALAIRTRTDAPMPIRMHRLSASWCDEFAIAEQHDVYLPQSGPPVIAHDARD